MNEASVADPDRLTDSAMHAMLGGGAPPSSSPSSAHQWLPPSADDIHRALPQYEVQQFLARGGMGAVYKGTQRALKRDVAIKVLPPEIDGDDMHFAERFKLEAQAMARLSHPNIVSVFDAGETADGLLYFVMEFIEGTDVQQMIAAEGKLEPQHALSIVAHVCDALAFAHEEGIIHRDIKPSNIMVDKKGRVKVADFGLAKAVNMESTMLTSANVAMGTPDFIAPEALIGGTVVDQRADVYAVGVMLYVMLTGKIPRGRFQMPTGVLPRLDPRYDAIVDKAMQTDRERRYASASAMRADIDGILTRPVAVQMQSVSQTANPGGHAAEGDAPPRLRRRGPLLAAVFAGIVAVAGGGVFVLKHSHASHSSSGNAGLASATEPGAIKLWDVPEKVALKPGVEWRNGALVLGGKTWGTLLYGQPKSRNAILRVSIRMNLNADRPTLALRCTGSGSAETRPRYALVVRPDKGEVNLLTIAAGDMPTVLGTWPLPRTYGVDEWARLELKAIDDTLTASLDGTVLGTVRDTSQTGPGEVMLFARANGYFRDIEYIPLDKASSVPAPIEPRAIPLWTSADQIPKISGVRWENGALRIDRSSIAYFGSCSRAAIVRAELRYNPGITDAGLTLRAFAPGSLSYYGFSLSSAGFRVVLNTGHPEAGRPPDSKVLQRWPVPDTIKPDQWVRLEFRVVGDTLTAMLDGQTLGSVQDRTLSEPSGMQIHSNATGFFRNVVYVPLDPVPPLEPGALKPWTSAETLPKQEGVTWEKGTILLRGHTILRHAGADSRDAVVRADVRRNADRLGTCIALRARDDAATKSEDSYKLTLDLPTVKLSVTHGGKNTELKSWPLHAPATNDDWVHLELRAIGDALTVSCDGQTLGTVHDSTLIAPGTLQLGAHANGWFRYVTYSPLDKSAASTPPKPIAKSPSYPQPAQWSDGTSDTRRKFVEAKVALLEGDALRIVKSPCAARLDGGREFGNAVVRIIASGRVFAILRKQDTAGGYYAAHLGLNGGGAIDYRTDEPSGAKAAHKHADGIPPAGFDLAAEHELVFATQSDQLTLWIDGIEKATLRDSTSATGTIGFQINAVDADAGAVRIRRIEYAELPDAKPKAKP